MKLQGKVVKVDTEKYTSKSTGQEMTVFKVWLQSGDPLEGATEFSCSEDDHKKIKNGQEIEFVPAFVIGSKFGVSVVKGRIVDSLLVKVA
jgi:hypothetical protein